MYYKYQWSQKRTLCSLNSSLVHFCFFSQYATCSVPATWGAPASVTSSYISNRRLINYPFTAPSNRHARKQRMYKGLGLRERFHSSWTERTDLSSTPPRLAEPDGWSGSISPSYCLAQISVAEQRNWWKTCDNFCCILLQVSAALKPPRTWKEKKLRAFDHRNYKRPSSTHRNFFSFSLHKIIM